MGKIRFLVIPSPMTCRRISDLFCKLHPTRTRLLLLGEQHYCKELEKLRYFLFNFDLGNCVNLRNLTQCNPSILLLLKLETRLSYAQSGFGVEARVGGNPVRGIKTLLRRFAVCPSAMPAHLRVLIDAAARTAVTVDLIDPRSA